ncbi:chondroitinase family polysaccharide lyase [Phycisphaerales bacterium AB-hyl4]|uniref:Chondroitinase family polysaccharide lyase n=1 Tax=Natronomicrosphaera hydrolytica TaxID=3242702 RepID=A0ABV4U6U2_9BACT
MFKPWFHCTAAVCFSSLVLQSTLTVSASDDWHFPAETFVDGVPSHWQATRPDSLSLTRHHYKYGEQSLQWDWRSGETIDIEQELGDLHQTAGYGGYEKATFGLWVYNDEPGEHELRFDFMEGDEVTGWFSLPLDYRGWRHASFKYTFRSDFEGEVTSDTDRIVIHAPEEVDSGTVRFDLVVYNNPLDFRQQHVPAHYDWQPVSDEQVEAKFPSRDKVTEHQLESLEQLRARLHPANRGNPDRHDFDDLRQRFEGFGIERDEHGIRGLPVVHSRRASFYEYSGLEVAAAADIHDVMFDVAELWYLTDDAEHEQALAEMYLDMFDHLFDQGMQPGSGFQYGWYNGRRLCDSIWMMAEVLRDHDRLREARDYLDYAYGWSKVVTEANPAPNLDHYHLDARYQLLGQFMFDDPVDQARGIQAFMDFISRGIMNPAHNAFKNDGSMWHHEAHYWAYAEYAIPTLIYLIEPLAEAGFTLTPSAYDRFKYSMLNLRFHANLLELPIPFHGRHPMANKPIRPDIYRALAVSRPGDGERSVTIDEQLAAAYLRLHADADAEEAFGGAVTEAEPHPEGTLSMPYAGMLAQRRDDWLVAVKGYNSQFWGTEIYDQENAHGGWIGSGDLYYLVAGDPISLAGSGYEHDGWDWNRFDGTTVIHLPLEELENPTGGTASTRTDHDFVGGLAHRDQHGIFVMQIQGPQWLRPDHRGKATYFFFDDRLVALGSNIRNDDETYPTHTNLFQRHLPERDTAITLNGDTLDAFPLDEEAVTGPAWLMDMHGTGFYVPDGQRIGISRKEQHSRDRHNTEDTVGDFAAAWIDHGQAPDDASYQYMVQLRTSERAMAELAERMASAEPPYRVIAQDERAHIVADDETSLIAGVLFESQDVDEIGPITHVSSPCLVMLESEDEGQYFLTVADPDLRLDDDYLSQPHEWSITLAGYWDVTAEALSQKPASEVVNVEADAQQTRVHVRTIDGQSLGMQLRLQE